MSQTIAGEIATAGRYRDVLGAPRGLRRIKKAGEITRLLAQVRELAELELRAQGSREAIVDDLRRSGGSWDTVGWVLGVTGSAARQRYGGRRT